MSWDFERVESTPTVQAGKLRCVITNVEEAVSKSGNQMLVISVRPSGSKANVRWYAVEGEWFKKNMTNFFDAFPSLGGAEKEQAFKEGKTNFIEWVGTEGAANFGFDDKGYLKVKWFLTPWQSKDLPAFEGDKPEKQEVNNPFTDEEDEGDLPF